MGPEIGFLETTFLERAGHEWNGSREGNKQSIPVSQEHSHIHGCNRENYVEPRVLWSDEIISNN